MRTRRWPVSMRGNNASPNSCFGGCPNVAPTSATSGDPRAGEIAALADVPLADLVKVIDVFRAPGSNFLTPPWPEPIRAETVLDISHESLIRQWSRLRDWAEQEAQSARNLPLS